MEIRLDQQESRSLNVLGLGPTDVILANYPPNKMDLRAWQLLCGFLGAFTCGVNFVITCQCIYWRYYGAALTHSVFGLLFGALAIIWLQRPRVKRWWED